jgi:hypothetical protein
MKRRNGDKREEYRVKLQRGK